MRFANRSTLSYLSFILMLVVFSILLGFFGKELTGKVTEYDDIFYLYIFVLFVSLLTLRGLYLRVRYFFYLGLITISLVILSLPLFDAYRIPVLIIPPVVSLVPLYFLLKFHWYYNFPTKFFDRPEISISIVAIIIVLTIGILGTIVLGNQFNPPIRNIITAFYYTGEVITTLGFGDIVPVTHIARIFTVSLSIIGIASFFGSATVIAAPLIYNRSKKVISALEKVESNSIKGFVLFVDYSPLMGSLLKSLIANDFLIIVAINDESLEKELPESGIFVEKHRNLDKVIESFDLRRAKKIVLSASDDGKNVLNAIHINSLYPDNQVKGKIIAVVNAPGNIPKISTLVGHIISPADLIVSDAKGLF